MKMYAVIRIRGEVDLRKELKETLRMLGLDRKNHLVLKPETEAIKFMLKKVEPFIAFGEIDEKTFAEMLEKRGRLPGDKRLDEAFLKKHGLSSFSDAAKKLSEKKITLKKLEIKKVFRLNAPRKGFERKGTKKLFSVGGAAGYRASAINELIRRMM